MMQVSKKVPFDDPDVLLLVRGLYVLSNVIILSLYLYTQAQITKKNGWYSASPASPHLLSERETPGL